MKNNILQLLFLVAILSFSSCMDDLNRYPTNDNTPDKAYSTFEGYQQVFAKVCGSYALTGQNGPASSVESKGADVVGLDEGNYADFLRGFFNVQVLSTEEAICAWGDTGVSDLNFLDFTSDNPFTKGFYYRCMFQIKMANEFLKESTESKVSSRGMTQAQADQIKVFRNEARFLRAFQYWVLMDVFGNPPFIDEASPTGKFLPPQISRADLFKFVESELLAIEPNMVEARKNEYGRADQAAVWALLARLYLNAEVYTGQKKYTEAITYSQKVIAAGYSLKKNYGELFLADNNLNNPEVILSINYDGLKSKNFAGTTYLVNSAYSAGRTDVPADYNKLYGSPSNGWGGNRTRPSLPNLFDKTGDARFTFYGGKNDIDGPGTFTDGLAAMKFRNVTASGAPTSNPSESFTDIDFPLFRLAEMYLVYAEAVLRGGTGGDQATATSYVNKLRERAFGGTSNNFSTITLATVLDERGRELYWECFRRTDLIRYGQYTTNARLWQWKGGVKAGRAVDSHFNLCPIPSADLNANPNLKQNAGY